MQLTLRRPHAAQAEAAQTALFEPGPYVREAIPSPINLQMMLTRPGMGFVAEVVAMQVPAFAKAVTTFSHTISVFPLREYVNGQEIVPRAFLNSPSEGLTYSAEMMRVVKDLLLYEKAWWRITSRTWDNFPASIVRMPANEVSDLDGRILWNGYPVPERDVIRFDGDGLGGWLTRGAVAIMTAAALENATLRYADSPLPQIILKNNGADLPAEVVDGLLTAWEDARRDHATAYLNSTIDAKPMGWNAAELQLVDAKNSAAVQIARMANLDPVWVGAGVAGGSLTYSNRVDLYRQLLDLSLSPVMNLISQRLSRNDVTPRGHEVRFDPSVFLRQNAGDVAQVINTLLPLNVLSVAEARMMLDMPGVAT